MVRNIKVMNMAGRDLASRNDINKSSRNLKEGSVKYEIHRIYFLPMKNAEYAPRDYRNV